MIRERSSHAVGVYELWHFNDDQENEMCIKCEMDKAMAMTMAVKVRKRMCRVRAYAQVEHVLPPFH